MMHQQEWYEDPSPPCELLIEDVVLRVSSHPEWQLSRNMSNLRQVLISASFFASLSHAPSQSMWVNVQERLGTGDGGTMRMLTVF
mmetsp:Transcript_58586/g.97255  ORF Transcript_58586/g.97255 Transcript_58586/m.97255 type:complete len:85 (-) Transcript_58586:699-953(-)